MSSITNKICSCFKMTVDMKGLNKLEKYISDLEKENEHLKEQTKLLSAKKPIKDLKERNDQLMEQYRF